MQTVIQSQDHLDDNLQIASNSGVYPL